MEWLRLLESIRSPFFNELFLWITKLGEETIFILVSFLIFWCVDKKKGYFLLLVNFWGLLINQFLKIHFRVPRPWVKEKHFTVVESALEEASGYSFPSGHTQIAVGTYGSIARSFSSVWVRFLCLFLCVSVAFSRMYLGVHTFSDVGVSILIGVLLIFILYPLVNRLMEQKWGMRILIWLMMGASLVYLLYMECYPFPTDADAENLAHAAEYAYKIFGMTIGAWVGYEIDAKYICFETRAVWWAQVLKLLLGLVCVLMMKSFLKQPLIALFGNELLAGAVRYGMITVFACGIWPLTFRWFQKLSQ